MDLPQIDREAIPLISADQMREVDRIMIEEVGIELIQMMENAGRNLADLAIRRFAPGSVVVLAGNGGNGGGGLVAARHLANRGVRVTVILVATSAKLTRVPGHQFGILQRMGVEIAVNPTAADLVVDAMIGYSLSGDPTGRSAELIDWANQQAAVLSLDNPSGLDVTTGVAGSPCVAATATMTLALPKTGLVTADQAGELYLADISVPPSVYSSIGLGQVDLFADGTIIR
ncbi:MAG TPA: NAD(P)H-hydrate epimerase, partial [Actinobacteria bacterium]|nr:NAD(P)H-hydrate epimerase [Actinomycetota bacterium]